MAEAVIEEIGKDETRCRVTAVHERFNEPPVEVTLLQGVLKNPGKMDWLAEKGTELGMTAFVPLLTEFTVARSVKTARLQRIAETATKQCFRGHIPTVHEAQSFDDALRRLLPESGTADAGVRPLPESGPQDADIDSRPECGEADAGVRLLLFHESAPLDAVPETLEFDGRPLALFVGPEGGFSLAEVASLRAHGADVLSLGPRRLRGETAGVVALARIAAILARGTL